MPIPLNVGTKMAQFDPESLALSLRNHWHSLIRNSQWLPQDPYPESEIEEKTNNLLFWCVLAISDQTVPVISEG